MSAHVTIFLEVTAGILFIMKLYVTQILLLCDFNRSWMTMYRAEIYMQHLFFVIFIDFFDIIKKNTT